MAIKKRFIQKEVIDKKEKLGVLIQQQKFNFKTLKLSLKLKKAIK